MCRNAEAFKKRVGFLGIDIQAERLLKAFTSRGLELRDDIMYYSPDSNADIEKLPVKPASQDEVRSGSRSCISHTLGHVQQTEQQQHYVFVQMFAVCVRQT